MELKLWPWQNGVEPYFVNGEFEWYKDDYVTRHCQAGSLPPIEAVAFIVAERSGEKVQALERILMDKFGPIYSTTRLEDLYAHIDMLRIAKSFEE